MSVEMLFALAFVDVGMFIVGCIEIVDQAHHSSKFGDYCR